MPSEFQFKEPPLPLKFQNPSVMVYGYFLEMANDHDSRLIMIHVCGYQAENERNGPPF